MNYLLTCSYANQQVAEKSYGQLVKTMVKDPLPVWLWDNTYPLNEPQTMQKICKKYGFDYFSTNDMGGNVGMYAAYNFLINSLPDDAEIAVFYDGDQFPVQPNWHLALIEVVKCKKYYCATLNNHISQREMTERGYDVSEVNGIRLQVPKQACTNTICAFDVKFLRETGGLRGGKLYYGGNEIEMWPQLQYHWAFLTDFWDDFNQCKVLHDWQYEQYKLLYAHKGMDMSFEQYVKSNPDRIYDLEKTIFG